VVVLIFFAMLYEVWAVLGGVTRNNLSLTCSKGNSGILLFGRVMLGQRTNPKSIRVIDLNGFDRTVVE